MRSQDKTTDKSDGYLKFHLIFTNIKYLTTGYINNRQYEELPELCGHGVMATVQLL